MLPEIILNIKEEGGMVILYPEPRMPLNQNPPLE